MLTAKRSKYRSNPFSGSLLNDLSLMDGLAFAGLGTPVGNQIVDLSGSGYRGTPFSAPTPYFVDELQQWGFDYSGSNYHELPDLGWGFYVPFTNTGLAYDADIDGNGNPGFWVGDFSGGRIVPYYPDGNQIVGSIISGLTVDKLQGVALDTSDDTIWYSFVNDQTIRHINKSGTDQGDGFNTGSADTNHVCYKASTDELFVARTTNTVEWFDCATGSSQGSFTITGATNIDGLTHDAANDYLYVSCTYSSSDAVLVVNDSTGTIIDNFTVGSNYEGLAITGGGTIWMCHDVRGVSLLGTRVLPYDITTFLPKRHHFHGPFAISCWVNPDVSLTNNGIISGRSTSDTGVFFLTSGTGSRATFRVYNTSASATTLTASAGNAMSTGTWYHICAWWDGARIYLYQNGQSAVSSASFTGPLGSNGITGISVGGYFSTSNLYNGKIAGVCVWNRGLSPVEAKRLYDLDAWRFPTRKAYSLPSEFASSVSPKLTLLGVS